MPIKNCLKKYLPNIIQRAIVLKEAAQNKRGICIVIASWFRNLNLLDAWGKI